MKILAPLAFIFALVFSIALVIAAWPTMPLMGLIAVGLALVIGALAGLAGVYYLWCKATAIRLEASKVHADNSAVFTGPGQIVQLQPGPIGYGSVSQLHHYAPRLEVQPGHQAAPVAAPPALEPAPGPGQGQPVEPITAAAALDLLPFNRLALCFGTDSTGQPVYNNLNNSVHILLSGSSGQGKSYLAQNLLLQLVSRNNPEKLNLALLDVEGETSEPFTDHAVITATAPAEIVEAMSALRAELDSRYNRSGADWQALPGATWLIFIEEALALRRYLDKGQLARYAADFEQIALRGRKRGIFIMAASQVEYSNLDFRAAQGQFMSRLTGACKPSAGRAMGFTNTELLNRLARERQPGQFLLEAPAGDRIIRAPILERRLLSQLLPASSTGQAWTTTSAAYEPTRAAPGPQFWPTGTNYQPTGQTAAYRPVDMVTASYRELPAGTSAAWPGGAPGPAPANQGNTSEIDQAIAAYRSGATTTRALAAALGCGKDKAARLINQARQAGLI